jgi:hypothetical protein
MAKRLVTEADVRAMAPGSCLSLGGGTIATPAALDLAHQRGVRVRWDGEPEHAASSALWKKLTARDGAYVVVVSNGRATAHRLEDGGPVLVGNEGGAS